MSRLVFVLTAALIAVCIAIGSIVLLSQGQPSATPPSQLIKQVTLVAESNKLLIAPDNQLHPGGIWYNAMTFNDTIPAPLIVVNQGDIVRITLQNKDEIVHSLNLHAGTGPSDTLSGVVLPGQNKTITLKAEKAGFFMYHCDGDNLNGIWEHIADGMYGGMLVRAANQAPAKEFYVAFGEVYNSADRGLFAPANGTGSFDMEKFLQNKPDLVLTNGMAYKYVPFIGGFNKITLNPNAEIFKVRPGELTRWYILNVGPREQVAFNFSPSPVITETSGQPASLDGVISIPPGSARVLETRFPEAGYYFGNDHDLGHLLIGSGFTVRATNSANETEFPTGTSVPS